MPDTSSTFAKGLRVLEAFRDASPQLTMPQIVEITGLDRASVRRLVLTLVDEGYLTPKESRSYQLTPKVLALAGTYLQGNRIGVLIQPILNVAAKDLGTSVTVAMREGTEAIYLAQSSLPDTVISMGFTTGSRLPLLHTAIGRMLLAFEVPDTRAPLLASAPLHRFTPQSLTNRAAVSDDITRAETLGYSIVCDEFEAGITGLAVPVGGPGRCRAVLGLSRAIEDLSTKDQVSAHVARLRTCALEIDRTQIFR